MGFKVQVDGQEVSCDGIGDLRELLKELNIARAIRREVTQAQVGLESMSDVRNRVTVRELMLCLPEDQEALLREIRVRGQVSQRDLRTALSIKLPQLKEMLRCITRRYEEAGLPNPILRDKIFRKQKPVYLYSLVDQK